MAATETVRLRDALEKMSLPRWLKTDGIIALLNKSQHWGEEAWGAALKDPIKQLQRVLVRRAIRELRAPEGHRKIASIEITDEEGKTYRVYKQEDAFSLDDYKQTCAYHLGRASYHLREAQGLSRRCHGRHGQHVLSEQQRQGELGLTCDEDLPQ